MARRPVSEPRFRFQFVGWQNGWYVLRLPTRNRPALAVHGYQNTVLDWLIEQAITPNEQSYFANGNTGDGPVVPAAADGSVLCLLLKRAVDVVRFERQFGCRDLTPETMFEALRAEASVHRFGRTDIAIVAYDAIRRLTLIHDEAYPEWDDRSRNEQQFFLQIVQEYMEHADWSADNSHTAWMERRVSEGWTYAPEMHLDDHRHPWIVPFTKLSERDQAATRLIVSSITSLLALIWRP